MPYPSSLPIGLTLLAFTSLSFTVLSPRPGRVPGAQPVLSEDLLNGQADVPHTKLGASPLFISRTSRCHHHPSPLRSTWWETQWSFLGYFTGTHRTGGATGRPLQRQLPPRQGALTPATELGPRTALACPPVLGGLYPEQLRAASFQSVSPVQPDSLSCRDAFKAAAPGPWFAQKPLCGAVCPVFSRPLS